MNLLMISHKETWLTAADECVTVGGFPFQARAIAGLFDSTRLIVTRRNTTPPNGVQSLEAPGLSVLALPEPAGSDLRRKLALLAWLPRHLPVIWREIARADAIHTPVPGDIGFIGLLLALIQRKPLFVRHCGTWGKPVTAADRALLWLLERIAGGRNVVLATGEAEAPPSQQNPHVHWIFSTTLTEDELAQCPCSQPWKRGEPLQLVTVSRLSPKKNTQAIIRALPLIRERHPNVCLHVVGDGAARASLESLANALGLRDQVIFYGNVAHSQVLRILSRSHLFVLPTRVKEGFPKAVLESLACGVPVVASNVSALPRLIQGCGQVLPGTEPEDVARMVRELTADEHALADMAACARRKAREYTLEQWQALIGARLTVAWGPLKRQATSLLAPSPVRAL